jgi:hypothetical protein
VYVEATEERDIYRYCPAFAVLVSPLAFLPPGVGNALWKLINVGVFGLGLWVWCRRALPGYWNRNAIAVVFLVAAFVAGRSAYSGQANLLMTGFLLLGLTAAVEDRWWSAAVYVAAATLIKGFPLGLALILAVLFWRTFPLRFLVALLLGLALPFATARPEYAANQTEQWARHLTESVELNRDRLRSLSGLLEMSGVAVDPSVFLLFGAVAGAGVLAATLWTRERGADRRTVLLRAAAWFLTWAVLFSPSSENATYAILAPVVGWAVADAFGRPGFVRRVWVLTSLYFLGYSFGGDYGGLNRYVGRYCWVTVGGILFQAVLVWDLVNPPAAPPSVAGGDKTPLKE